MQIKFSVLCLIILCLSCNNNNGKGNAAGSIDSQFNSNQGIRSEAKEKMKADTSMGEMTPDRKKELSDYIKRYKTPYILDSIFIFGHDTMEVKLNHYCLMDSAIIVPGYFLKLYNLKKFVTHNFATEITLKKNNKEILKKTVRKEDFANLIDPHLMDDAVLLYPEVSKNLNSINLDYSISIPLTDVGTGINMIINKDGKIEYKAH